jgi:tRNA pseudouridine synthase 2
VELHVTPGVPPEPSRLDAYLTANSPEVSRARIVTTIKAGLVDVNGKVMKKPAYKISSGDHIRCKFLAPPLLEALPEDIPLDVHYEDEHLLVINKPAQMVRT